MRKFRIVFASLGLAAFMLAPALPVSASTDVFEGPCDEPGAQNSSVCDANGGDPITGDQGVIIRVINFVSVIAGILAVLIIMWGGFTYITSGGDTQKTTMARNTILYASIGLVVIVLAQTIVTFILRNAGF